jgi:formylglycine-generating enzyme required for sulfatase activity
MSDHKLNVFLCHAKEDKPMVRELYRKLAAEGWINPWIDEKNIILGQDWDLKIQKELEFADAVIVFISETAMKKDGYVQKELRLIYDIALYKPEDTIFIAPLRLEECQPPYRFRLWQWGDYFGEKKDETYSELIKSLKLRYEQVLQIEAKRHAQSEESAHKQAEEQARKEKEEWERKAAEERALLLDEQKAEAKRAAKAERERLSHQKTEERKKATAEAFRLFLTIGGIVIVLSILFFVGKFIIANLPSVPMPSQTSKVSPTFTFISPTEPPTEMPTIAFTLTPGIGDTWTSPKDGMVMMSVPAGKFLMGSNFGADDEYPLHEVELATFWIDRTEVTNAMYAKCVHDGKCNRPLNITYFSNPEYADHPVVYVSWKDANAYCEWRDDGTLLPTEAEWEKAASWDAGKKINRIYPWGNNFDGSLLNFCDRKCPYAWTDGTVVDGYAKTAPVGHYTSGASYYGVLDMAGNVWEWVSDWYLPYRGNTEGEEHYGTKYRVRRGGSWYSDDYKSRSLFRSWLSPSNMDDQTGFRCARSLP